MPDPAYKRLSRDRVTQQFSVVTATRASLWQGPDHILLVQNSGFTETYKRFYFRDIQAITVLETNRRAIWNAILGIPFGLCVVGALASAMPNANIAAVVTWAIFAFIFFLPLLINNIRGTACKCQLRTAVQTEYLGSLSRVRQTQKVLTKIRPLIAAFQGELTPEEISARMRSVAAEELPAQNPPPSAAPTVIS